MCSPTTHIPISQTRGHRGTHYISNQTDKNRTQKNIYIYISQHFSLGRSVESISVEKYQWSMTNVGNTYDLIFTTLPSTSSCCPFIMGSFAQMPPMTYSVHSTGTRLSPDTAPPSPPFIIEPPTEPGDRTTSAKPHVSPGCARSLPECPIPVRAQVVYAAENTIKRTPFAPKRQINYGQFLGGLCLRGRVNVYPFLPACPLPRKNFRREDPWPSASSWSGTPTVRIPGKSHRPPAACAARTPSCRRAQPPSCRLMRFEKKKKSMKSKYDVRYQ